MDPLLSRLEAHQPQRKMFLRKHLASPFYQELAAKFQSPRQNASPAEVEHFKRTKLFTGILSDHRAGAKQPNVTALRSYTTIPVHFSSTLIRIVLATFSKMSRTCEMQQVTRSRFKSLFDHIGQFPPECRLFCHVLYLMGFITHFDSMSLYYFKTTRPA